jgi:hypothetical protein
VAPASGRELHVQRAELSELSSEGHVAIVDDYAAIAKRLRELKLESQSTPTPERWSDLEADAKRIYAQNRRTGPFSDLLLQKRPAAPGRR